MKGQICVCVCVRCECSVCAVRLGAWNVLIFFPIDWTLIFPSH